MSDHIKSQLELDVEARMRREGIPIRDESDPGRRLARLLEHRRAFALHGPTPGPEHESRRIRPVQSASTPRRTQAGELVVWQEMAEAGLLMPLGPAPRRTIRQRLRDAWAGMLEGWRYGDGS